MTLAATASFVRPLLAGGPESLLEAVAAGNLDLVRGILDRGVSPNATDRLGHTALMLAADRGDRDVAEAILDHGAAINATTSAGNTALMTAAYRGRLEVVRLLLERDADVTAVNAEGRTALALAREAQYPAVVALLLGAIPPGQSTWSRGRALVGTAPMLRGPSSTSTLQTVAAPTQAAEASPHHLEPVLGNLSNPLYVTNARDGSNRLFVVEQGGRILVLQLQASTPTVFLDLTPLVLSGGEQGLLGLAFHPDYAVNRRFFVNYTRRPDGPP